ncbi:FxDxF family PEP-CTERM protein [Methylobacillus sp. Pita2]|uniref:FxDxF family PEP-CTERM protein n=1 Tax=Methylobacillus sp. Pita2 TaxID=3383245 RepID=UPI0038B5461F
MIKHLVGSAALAVTMMASVAQANDTAAPFVDVADSAEFNGWNQLYRPLTVDDIVAGYSANVAGSGDAVFTRIAGTAYPAGGGLYEYAGAFSTFTLTDFTVADSLTSIVFQSHSAAGGTGKGLYDVSLSYTIDGVDYLAALVDNNAQADAYKYFSWDLSSVTGIDAIKVTFSTEAHANSFAFQLDQVVAAVPEPSEYALLLAGLAFVGFAARRKQQA